MSGPYLEVPCVACGKIRRQYKAKSPPAILCRRCSPKSAEERFWAKVDKNGPVPAHRPQLGPCWISSAGVGSHGYPQIKNEGVTETVNRFAWVLHHGPIPEGLHVLHGCDIRRCVKAIEDAMGPAHLFLGTHLDNVADMDAKGRRVTGPFPAETRARGEDSGITKVTAADVIEMRRLSREGASYAELAKRFGMTKGGIAAIVKRKTWRHVP